MENLKKTNTSKEKSKTKNNSSRTGIVVSMTSSLTALLISLTAITTNKIPSNNNFEHPYFNEMHMEHQVQEEKEKEIYKMYNIVIENEIKKATLDKDTLHKKVLEELQLKLRVVSTK